MKLGLEDIANSLKTGSIPGEAGEMGGDVVGGLLGQLQAQLGNYIVHKMTYDKCVSIALIFLLLILGTGHYLWRGVAPKRKGLGKPNFE